ncbi:MAG: hypothetical protein SGI77_01980 [Pirellulaceae bacterium]|nr:hypothetical protein [Pirellulaceae bacterium]
MIFRRIRSSQWLCVLMNIYRCKCPTLNVLVSFAMFATSASNGYSQEVVQTKSEGRSLVKAILANVTSLRSYDVRVEAWNSKSVKDGALEKRFSPVELKSTYRLVCDLDSERVFVIRRYQTIAKLNEGIDHQIVTETTISHYFEGSSRSVSLSHETDFGKPRKVDFLTYCRDARIELPQFLGIKIQSQVSYTQPIEQIVERVLESHATSVLETGSNGVMRLHLSPDRSSKSRSINLIDPSSLMPIKRSSSSEKDGIWTGGYTHDVQYEKFKGIYLPVYLSCSFLSHVPNPKDLHGKGLPCDEVGTVELRWFKVNDKELAFPDILKTGTGPKVWEEFLDPKETSKKP